jgi:ADP-dependent phosphofructokinase/glucokinase
LEKILKAGKGALPVFDLVEEVSDFKSFLSVFLHSFSLGKAVHVPVTEDFVGELQSAFKAPDKQKLGGQAGIVASQLSALGSPSILYSPLLSAEEAQFVHSGVKRPTTKNGKLVLQGMEKIRELGGVKINWIIEFKEGERISFLGKTLVAPRANRVILSSPVNMVPVFDPDLEPLLPQLGKKIDFVFLSGLQYLRQRYADGRTCDSVLKREEKLLKDLKAGNKKLLVHYEYVPAKNAIVDDKILENVRLFADSCGINEVELRKALWELGFEEEAKNLEEKESVANLLLGAEKLFFALKLKRLHVHTLGYYIELRKIEKNKSGVSPEKIVDSLLFASLASTARAAEGKEVSMMQVRKHAGVPVSEIGLRALEEAAQELGGDEFLKKGFAEKNGVFYFVVPAQVNERPKGTVGLGDTVSSSALVAELNWRK